MKVISQRFKYTTSSGNVPGPPGVLLVVTVVKCGNGITLYIFFLLIVVFNYVLYIKIIFLSIIFLMYIL
jgi:hypothetical protein